MEPDQAAAAVAVAGFVEKDELGEEVRNLFVQFVEHFRSSPQRVDSDPDYVQQIGIMRANDRSTLYVDYVHMLHHNADLGEAVQDDYYRLEPFLCEGLKLCVAHRFPDYLYADDVEKKENVFWVAFYNVPAVQKLRDLTSNKIGKLLSIAGTVTRTSEVRPELLRARFVCRECNALTSFVIQQFTYTEPAKCASEHCTNTKHWTLDAGTSVFSDWQKVRIQEGSADIPSGSMPRSLDVVLRNEAVDKAKAGDNSIFTGTLIVVPDVTQFNLPGVKAKGRTTTAGSSGDGTRGIKQTGVRDLTYRLCFLASTVRLAELRSGSINLREEEEDNVVEELTEAQKKDIFEMSQRPNIYGLLAQSVAPTVFGHDEVKRGLLLMLMGGVHKETMEGIHLRGDINICIVGDPSTSKSQFLKYVVKFMPRAVYTSGKASSAAGLTATVAKDPDTGEFNIEAGALMLADNGICCIAKGTPVSLADGTARSIELIVVGSLLESPRYVTGAAAVACDVDAVCTRVLPMGCKHCVEVTLEDGRTLVCTPDHRLLTSCGTWVEAAALDVDGSTRLAVSSTVAPAVDVSDHGDATSDDRQLAFARMLGFASGSVSVSCAAAARLTLDHALDAARVRADVSLFCICEPRVQEMHTSGAFCVELPASLLYAITAAAAEPLFLDTAPIAVIREYLAAFAGACGTAPYLSATERPPLLQRVLLATTHQVGHARHLVSLLSRCRVVADVVGVCGGWHQVVVRDTVQFAERVGFRYCVQKQVQLGVACVWLRMAAQQCADNFVDDDDDDGVLAAVGARGWLALGARPVQRRATRLPTLALRVVRRRAVGLRHVYDLSVPGNTAFMAHGVAVHNCIDEFDKMDIRDQVAIHEAMEQQTISIAKAGIHATLNARTSVLAAANPVGGRYDKTKTLTGNLNISAPIMSRFDLFFIVIDEMDEAADYNIARHIVSIHRFGDAGVAPPFTTDQLYNYIRFGKTIKPTLTAEAQDVLVEEYKKLRQNDVGAAGKTAYRITVRQLESMVRLSEALARVHLESEVRPEYVREAARLLRKSIIHVESEDLVLTERARPAVAAAAVAAAAAVEVAPQPAANAGLSARAAPGAQTVSFTEYKRISELVVLHLRACEERGETGGKTTNDIVQWYLGQCEAVDEDDLARHNRLIALILKRLVSKDRVLVEHHVAAAERRGGDDGDDGDDGDGDIVLLTVHPNYVGGSQ